MTEGQTHLEVNSVTQIAISNNLVSSSILLVAYQRSEFRCQLTGSSGIQRSASLNASIAILISSIGLKIGIISVI